MDLRRFRKRSGFLNESQNYEPEESPLKAPSSLITTFLSSKWKRTPLPGVDSVRSTDEAATRSISVSLRFFPASSANKLWVNSRILFLFFLVVTAKSAKTRWRNSWEHLKCTFVTFFLLGNVFQGSGFVFEKVASDLKRVPLFILRHEESCLPPPELV